MKKTLSIFIMVLILGVFFCFPVNAQILYAGVARDIDQQGNIIMTTSVNQFDENSTSYHQAYLLVTVQLENISSSPTYVGYARFSLSFPDVDCHWDDFESYSNDAVLTRSVDGQYSSFKVIPNNEFSYNDGIVVPPNSSIYAIGIIGLRNSYDNAPVIQGFSVTNSIGTVATSDNYPYGQAVDYSPLITSLNSYFSTEHTDLSNILTVLGYLKVDTGNLNTTVNTIASLLEYSGLDPSLVFNYSLYNQVVNAGPPELVVRRTVYSGIPITYDFELNSTDDVIEQAGYFYEPVMISISHSNSSNSYSSSSIELIIPNIFPSGYRVEFVSMNSDEFYLWAYSTDLTLRYKQSRNSNSGIIPKGRNITTLMFRVYAPVGTTITMPTLDISNMNYTYTVYTDYAPRNILEAFKDFYKDWKGNSTTNNNISSDSGTLKTESDAIHQQEQTYYTQNRQAIEATGLRNYNFSQSQGDGIARVSLDFTNLWNSLGTFNSVYIFSLTLGLALTILRHAPNAISRIRWKKNQ